MDHSPLYETPEYGKQYSWVLVRNQVVPELKYRLGRLKRRNAKIEEDARIRAERMKNDPFYCGSWTAPTNEVQEDIERISYDQHFSHQVDERQTLTH